MLNIPTSQHISQQRAQYLELQVQSQIKQLLQKSKSIWPNLNITPTIRYDLKGMTAGMAHCGQNWIKLNPILLHENESTFLNRTLPHELAHLISVHLYGLQGRGHGHYWKQVMQQLEVKDIGRCHSYDTTNSRTRTSTRTIGYCTRCDVEVSLAPRHVKSLSLCTSRCCKSPITMKAPDQSLIDQAKKYTHSSKPVAIMNIQLFMKVPKDKAESLYMKAMR